MEGTTSSVPFVVGQGVDERTVWIAIGVASLGLAVLGLLSFASRKDRDGSTPWASTPAPSVAVRPVTPVEASLKHRASREEVVSGAERSALVGAADSLGAGGAGDVVVAVLPSAKVPEGERERRRFHAFQVSFLSADVVASFADWLKGAYTMSLYMEFGLSLSQVSMLFVCTYLSSMVFGTIAGSVSDTIGRARMCRAFCIIYAASLVLTLYNNMYVLCASRMLGGISTSLLATSFESWVITEHHTRRFDPSWLQDTFSKMAILGSASAVLAGFVAEYAVYRLGNVGPFLAPLPLLLAVLLLMRSWPENYGKGNVSTLRTLVNGWHDIRESGVLQLLCVSEALYEGSLGVWLFMWTPALDITNRQTPFGLVFAACTLCMVGGSVLARLVPLGPLLAVCHTSGIASLLASAVFFNNKVVVLTAFLLFEFSAGVYNVAHPTLRSQLIADGTRSSVMNLFRLPMNFLVVSVLLLNLSPACALWVLVALQSVSGGALLALSTVAKKW